MSESDVEDAFDDFDRSWAESHGVFERRTIQRELELVVMPGCESVAPEVAKPRTAGTARPGPSPCSPCTSSG